MCRYVCTHMYVYIYIYVDIDRERERETYTMTYYDHTIYTRITLITYTTAIICMS